MSDLQSQIQSKIEKELNLGKWVTMGGKGSGHWRHRGRKGKRGGSAPSRGGGPKPDRPTNMAKRDGWVGGHELHDVITWPTPNKRLQAIAKRLGEKEEFYLNRDGSISFEGGIEEFETKLLEHGLQWMGKLFDEDTNKLVRTVRRPKDIPEAVKVPAGFFD